VVKKRCGGRDAVSHLFPCEDKTLLLWWNAFDFFNLALDVEDLIWEERLRGRRKLSRQRGTELVRVSSAAKSGLEEESAGTGRVQNLIIWLNVDLKLFASQGLAESARVRRREVFWSQGSFRVWEVETRSLGRFMRSLGRIPVYLHFDHHGYYV